MSKSIQTIEIELSKKKLLLMLIGSLAFVAIGLWFIISPPISSNSFKTNPIILAVSGYASILFFGVCAIFLFKKLADNKLGLIIDQKGITDNSSGVSAGEILWCDIEDISVIKIHSQNIIMMQIKNPQDYIDRQTSPFKRRLMQMNYKMYGSPVSLTSNGLKISFDELLSILKGKLMEYQYK